VAAHFFEALRRHYTTGRASCQDGNCGKFHPGRCKVVGRREPVSVSLLAGDLYGGGQTLCRSVASSLSGPIDNRRAVAQNRFINESAVGMQRLVAAYRPAGAKGRAGGQGCHAGRGRGAEDFTAACGVLLPISGWPRVTTWRASGRPAWPSPPPPAHGAGTCPPCSWAARCGTRPWLAPCRPPVAPCRRRSAPQRWLPGPA
jgi:hypothetical protein